MIKVFNLHNEDYTNGDGYYVYCGRHKNKDTKMNDNPLGNPYTHDGKRSNLATLTFKTREEAIDAFEKYFDAAYGVDKELTKAFDIVYAHYKNGENIYLGCFCKPLPCHCDIIADRLQRKLIKEKLEERKQMLNNIKS